MITYRKIILTPLLLAVLAGCEAMKTGVPAVNSEMARAAAANGNSIETLVAGRRAFAIRCTSCHAPVPIAKYPSTEWGAKVLRMADRARLTTAETAQITAYLVAARESL